MKTLKIAKITSPENFTQLSEALESAERHAIDTNNWHALYPYSPNVNFSILHDGENIHIRYRVDEATVAAVAETDNGSVWCDSCVEFFVTFNGKGYYNIETNAAGRVLIGYRVPGNDKFSATSDILSSVKRYPSLGEAPFAEIESDKEWQLTLTIPKTAFFKDSITNLSGIEARANFYKCGDELKTPHYLSWSPIENEKPNFHKPEFFGRIVFE